MTPKINPTSKTLKQVEKDLNALFEKYHIQKTASVAEIKKWIWNARGETAMEAIHRFQKKSLRLFPEPDDIDDANQILQVLMDAWNYFPHKALGGKSPDHLMRKTMKDVPNDDPGDDHKMPKVIVGNIEMEWEEYQQMLKAMEKAQVPFKKWIDEDALPKYESYLAQVARSEHTKKQHHDVAARFFDRVLHVGFVTMEQIRPDFIQKEFPHWWPTHMLYSDMTPSQVSRSLEKLFTFLELVYGYDAKGYGFAK